MKWNHLCHCTAALLVLVCWTQQVAASDDASITAPPALTLAPPAQGWSNSGRIGAFFSNVATSNAANSRDATISNAQGSEAWLLAYDDTLLWADANKSVDQNLRLRYGRIDISGNTWTDNSDEVHYAGVFRRNLSMLTFLYGADGVDTVFRNAIDHHAFDPVTAKVSGGIGQLYNGIFLHGDPTKKNQGQDRLEVRLGVRAQKRWSRFDLKAQDEIEVGPEGFLRYDRPVDPNLRWYLQYEIFSEFKDIRHISQLLSAGFTAQLSKYVSADVSLRAYHERQPKNVPNGTLGYDQWSLREDALVGLTIGY